MTSADFIRSLPDMPAKEVVERGRRLGLLFSPQYVYAIRRWARYPAPVKFGKGRRRPPPQTALHETIDRLARQLVDEIMRTLQGAALDDVLGI